MIFGSIDLSFDWNLLDTKYFENRGLMLVDMLISPIGELILPTKQPFGGQ